MDRSGVRVHVAGRAERVGEQLVDARDSSTAPGSARPRRDARAARRAPLPTVKVARSASPRSSARDRASAIAPAPRSMPSALAAPRASAASARSPVPQPSPAPSCPPDLGASRAASRCRVIGAAVPRLRARLALCDAHSSKQHAGGRSSGSTKASVRRRSPDRNRYRRDVGQDRDRIEAYLRWREESTSTRVEASRFGTALFNDDFPSYWDGNFLRVDERRRRDRRAADRRDGPVVRGLVSPRDRRPRRRGGVAPGRFFRTRGLGDRPPGVHGATAGPRWRFGRGRGGMHVRRGLPADARDQSREPRRHDAGGRRDERRRSTGVHGCHGCAILRRSRRRRLGGLRRALRARRCGRDRRRAYAGALPSARHRRAVVGRIVREARDVGAEIIFLIADDADWPKELYAKLGFDPVGRFWQFTKPPEGESYR